MIVEWIWKKVINRKLFMCPICFLSGGLITSCISFPEAIIMIILFILFIEGLYFFGWMQDWDLKQL